MRSRVDQADEDAHARDEEPPNEFDGLLFSGQLGE